MGKRTVRHCFHFRYCARKQLNK